jgi:hypothetical protein
MGGRGPDLVYSPGLIPSGSIMPIRTATLNRQIKNNGVRLHLAITSRVHSQGAEQAASEPEQALLSERAELKRARADRQAQAKLPKLKLVRVVKEAKPKLPKAAKAPKPAKEPKAAKDGKGNKPSRADKQTKKAESLEAAKKADRKSAKT